MSGTYDIPFWAWLVLALVIGQSLTVDLVGHRGGHGQGRRQAALWTAGWITVALVFRVWVGLQFGARAAGEFATA